MKAPRRTAVAALAAFAMLLGTWETASAVQVQHFSGPVNSSNWRYSGFATVSGGSMGNSPSNPGPISLRVQTLSSSGSLLYAALGNGPLTTLHHSAQSSARSRCEWTIGGSDPTEISSGNVSFSCLRFT